MLIMLFTGISATIAASSSDACGGDEEKIDADEASGEREDDADDGDRVGPLGAREEAREGKDEETGRLDGEDVCKGACWSLPLRL